MSQLSFYKHFRFQVVLRLLLLLALGYATVYVALETYFWLVALWMGLAWIALTVLFIRYIEKGYRELRQFLVAAAQHDFSNTYQAVAAKAHNSLQPVLADLNQTFTDLRSERESSFRYLQTVVEHVAVALLCFDKNGEVMLFNRAAQKLFHKPYLHQLNSLESFSPALFKKIEQIQIGQRELVKINEQMTLAVRATEFKLLDISYKLVSFQNIKDELEQQEVEAWQKLIRVLTHEIMNSVIPISTLSSVIQDMLEEDMQPEHIEDLKQGLQTIEKRSSGLVNFVKAYKSITQSYQPKFQLIEPESICNQVVTLLAVQLQDNHVELAQNHQPNLQINADPELLEQALINLILNGIDAVKAKPDAQIELKSWQNEAGRIFIAIRDNGEGISPEVAENIFVPFFTTKEHGSGVGLSLGRQIMHLHKGQISLQTAEGKGSTFILTF